MKKVYLILTITILILLTGCTNTEQNMEDINIYTSTYPLNYLINYLYGENSKVYSIYPTGINIDEYELSDRKLEEYSKSNLFVFNSLDKDKEYAVKMINLNPKLKVIDSVLGMNYDYSVEELWLNPYNYLMMAENIKNGLIEYITNPFIDEKVAQNYEKLEYDISKLDSELTEAINGSTEKIIVVDNNLFKFLEKYGLTVISLEDDENLNTNKITEVKKLIADNKINYIYSTSKESNDIVKKLMKETEIELITINTMHSVDGNITNTNDNYLTIMTNNINLIKKELYN